MVFDNPPWHNQQRHPGRDAVTGRSGAGRPSRRAVVKEIGFHGHTVGAGFDEV